MPLEAKVYVGPNPFDDLLQIEMTVFSKFGYSIQPCHTIVDVKVWFGFS